MSNTNILKIALLLIVLLCSIITSHAQSLHSDFPLSFDGDVNDASGIVHAKLSVYPNPADYSLEVSVGSSKARKIIITVVNPNGKIVDVQQIENCKKSCTVNFNLSNYEEGMYVIKIGDDKVFQTKMLLLTY